MGRSTDGTKRSKFERLLIKSIRICVFGGTLFGASTWTLWRIVEGNDVSHILYLPVVVFTAIIPTTLIVGIVFGAIAAGLASFLATTPFILNPMTIWCGAGALAGAALSVIPLRVLLRISELQNPLLWFTVLGVAGFGCGLLVGRSAWHEFRK